MSIETKTDEHDEQRRPLHRWACLICSKRGVWVRDRNDARKGMHVHLDSRRHLERRRQLDAAREASLLERVANATDAGMMCECRTEVRGDELHVIPCTEEHGRHWAEHLPGHLARLGLAIPIEVEE